MPRELQRVLVLGRINEAGIARLREVGNFDIIERPDSPADLIDIASDASAIIVRTTPINRRLLDAAPELRIVARHGVGYDAVDVEALTERAIPLALTGDVNSGAVAEHAMALILALAKRVAAYDRAIREGNYSIRDTFSATELAGKTILLIGFGRIGRNVAKLCQAFSMRVLVSDPFVSSEDVSRLGCELAVDLHAGLANADWVTVHAPKSPNSKHLIGREELAVMKRGAFLVNVARGGMVDEAAVVEALDEGHLTGVGLDVTETEPLAPDHPLARHPATVLTPHSAAFTAECSGRMALACANNVIGFFGNRLDRSLVVNHEVLPELAGTKE